MGKGVTVKVTNAKAVIEDFKDYGKDSQKEILKEALKSGFVIQSKAKVRAPIKTGRLRSSIRTERRKEAVQVGTNVEYAPFVEDGTSRMKARPFLKNSFKEEIPKFIDRVKKVLRT